jgi:hypothetical protein
MMNYAARFIVRGRAPHLSATVLGLVTVALRVHTAGHAPVENNSRDSARCWQTSAVGIVGRAGKRNAIAACAAGSKSEFRCRYSANERVKSGEGGEADSSPIPFVWGSCRSRRLQIFGVSA